MLSDKQKELLAFEHKVEEVRQALRHLSETVVNAEHHAKLGDDIYNVLRELRHEAYPRLEAMSHMIGNEKMKDG